MKRGQIFSPAFLAMLANFRVLRFMDWSRTNGSPLSSWAGRPLPTDATWATDRGVPLEVAIQLSNALSADPWLNVPVMADDSYITEMAKLVHRLLGPSQQVYVEYSNEVWNSDFSQYEYAVRRGHALWPTHSSGNTNLRMESKLVWDADGADVRHLAGRLGRGCTQGNLYHGRSGCLDLFGHRIMECKYWMEGAPCFKHGIDALAIAPYFGDGKYPQNWRSQPDKGVSALFASLYSTDDPGIRGWRQIR